MSDQEKFPPEIYNLIIKHSRPKALALLARVRKAFQGLCEQRLYSRLSFEATSRQSEALQTLFLNPSKALYVEYLCVEFDTRNRTCLENAITRMALARTLKVAPNLKDLRVYDCKNVGLLADIEDAIWQVSPSILPWTHWPTRPSAQVLSA